MGFTLETGVSAAAVFLQGILSFFSPCVLPLVPLYIGYLAGGAKSVDADGTVRYKRGRVMRNTVPFLRWGWGLRRWAAFSPITARCLRASAAC